jgi:hypothetical protein
MFTGLDPERSAGLGSASQEGETLRKRNMFTGIISDIGEVLESSRGATRA